MSRSKHTQHPAGQRWNPPPLPQESAGAAAPQSIVSATEATGLKPRGADEEHRQVKHAGQTPANA